MNIKRRDLLFYLGASVGAAVFANKLSLPGIDIAFADAADAADAKAFSLPPLGYDYDALEPHIDARTMKFHHDKHHAAYVKNLNDAAAKFPQLKNKSAEDLIRNLNSVPEAVRTIVRNNGGGHVNHSMFWKIMGPKGGGEPTGAIAVAIKENFGSFAAFQKQFNEAGAKIFGSGWVWLVRSKDGKLKVATTPNQDNPITNGEHPIMGNDVWEHAYYLKYQNLRPDYLKAWWNVLNWEEINKRYAAALRSS